MATTFEWKTPEAPVTYFTTQLDSIANGAFSAAGAVINNDTDLYELIFFELVLASLSPAAGAYVDLWAEYAMDGTNYSDHGKPLQTTGLLGAIQLDTTAASAQRPPIAGPFLIKPYKMKISLRNMAGVALPTGNTLKYSRAFEQGV